MEATREPAERVEDALGRIERAVSEGRTDLTELGFWKVVGRVKRDPALTDAHADRIGRIDAAAFQARVRPRVPLWVGDVVLAGVVVAGGVAIVVASMTEGVIAGLALLGAAGAWSTGIHSPAHRVVGAAYGIRATSYFVGGPFPPRPGLKVDYATYLRTPARSRAWFHASGAIATKVAPFVALALAPLTNAPTWAVIATAALGMLEIATDVLFSVKTGDWKKFRREMAVARDAGAGLSAARSG